MYAINHDLPSGLASQLSQITIAVIMLSILAHGLSVKPIMDRFWRRRRNNPG
jgi:NhaP-type Na+/H+ or K+/H+ antiporter